MAFENNELSKNRHLKQILCMSSETVQRVVAEFTKMLKNTDFGLKIKSIGFP